MAHANVHAGTPCDQAQYAPGTAVPNGTRDPDSVLALKRFYAAEVQKQRALTEGRDGDADRHDAEQRSQLGDLAALPALALVDVEQKLLASVRELLIAVTGPGTGAAQQALALATSALLDVMVIRSEEGR